MASRSNEVNFQARASQLSSKVDVNCRPVPPLQLVSTQMLLQKTEAIVELSMAGGASRGLLFIVKSSQGGVATKSITIKFNSSYKVAMLSTNFDD